MIRATTKRDKGMRIIGAFIKAQLALLNLLLGRLIDISNGGACVEA